MLHQVEVLKLDFKGFIISQLSFLPWFFGAQALISRSCSPSGKAMDYLLLHSSQNQENKALIKWRSVVIFNQYQESCECCENSVVISLQSEQLVIADPPSLCRLRLAQLTSLHIPGRSAVDFRDQNSLVLDQPFQCQHQGTHQNHHWTFQRLLPTLHFDPV